MVHAVEGQYIASPKSTDREIYDYVLASCISLIMHLPALISGSSHQHISVNSK